MPCISAQDAPRYLVKVQALAASVISRPCQERHWLEMDLMITANQVTIRRKRALSLR